MCIARRALVHSSMALALIGVGFGSEARAQQPASQLASPTAPAAVPKSASSKINESLPSWIRLGGEYRIRWESRAAIAGREGQDDGFVLSRLRLDLTFDMGSHWRVFLQAQDSQAGGQAADPDPPAVENTIDLRQAYLEYRQSEKTGWRLRAGRQELIYGDQRVVGAFNWSNTARSFDAIKVGYTTSAAALEAFASSVVVVEEGAFDKHADGANFYGAHASFFKAVPKAELNAYVFWKTTPIAIDERGRLGDADTITFGGRLAGRLTKRADYTTEIIGQRGNFAGDDIRAAAAHARLGYTPSAKPSSPKLRLEYNYATGDGSPGDGTRGTYDQLYPTNHDKYGIIDQVGYRNLHNVRGGVVQKPHPRLTVEVDYNSFWLAHRRDGLYAASGLLVAKVAGGAGEAHVAQEADVQLTYAPRDGVTLAGGYGHWFPGAFWKAATPGSSQDFVFAQLTYKF